MNRAEKLAAAIEFLGSHWVLHESRRVPKGNYEQPVMRCDVAKTFERVRRRFTGAIEPSRG